MSHRHTSIRCLLLAVTLVLGFIGGCGDPAGVVLQYEQGADAEVASGDSSFSGGYYGDALAHYRNALVKLETAVSEAERLNPQDPCQLKRISSKLEYVRNQLAITQNKINYGSGSQATVPVTPYTGRDLVCPAPHDGSHGTGSGMPAGGTGTGDGNLPPGTGTGTGSGTGTGNGTGTGSGAAQQVVGTGTGNGTVPASAGDPDFDGLNQR